MRDYLFKNNFVLNRLEKKLQEQYWKYQSIKNNNNRITYQISN